MKRILLSCALFCLSLTAFGYDYLPDKSKTPGLSSSSTLQEICSPGYPERARNVSQSTKTKVYLNYGVDLKLCRGGCKIDHLIPLSIGGSNDISNLWPHEYSQFWSVYKKTRLEVRLRAEVCVNHMPLEDARECIASDWTACYNRFYFN